MDISKTWMLLQIEELTRQLPHLKAIHDDAMTQLGVIAEELTPGPKPKAVPSAQSELNLRRGGSNE